MSTKDLEKRIRKLEQQRGDSGNGNYCDDSRLEKSIRIVQVLADQGDERSRKLLDDYRRTTSDVDQRIKTFASQNGISEPKTFDGWKYLITDWASTCDTDREAAVALEELLKAEHYLIRQAHELQGGHTP